jgi:rhamnosyltransferase
MQNRFVNKSRKSEKNEFFIVGSRGLPASYSGYETLAEEIGTRLSQRGIGVHVTCEVASEEEIGPPEYRGVRLSYIQAPDNHLRTFISDYKALKHCAELADRGDVIYLLGYGIGPFLWPVLREIRQKGIRFWINPDGLEWKRSRWPAVVRRYLRFAEGFIARRADRIIADAVAIKNYLQRQYALPDKKFSVVEYGAPKSEAADDRNVEEEVFAFLREHGLVEGEYFMKVARCVPENNIALIAKAFAQTPEIKKKLLVITNRDSENAYYHKLRQIVAKNGAEKRVYILGPIYDQPFLRHLRRKAYGYLHGHEVGGTNPSLVEAMGEASFILALDSEFSREVLGNAALFYDKEVNDVAQKVMKAIDLPDTEIEQYQTRAKARVETHYNWERITDCYELLLQGEPLSSPSGGVSATETIG